MKLTAFSLFLSFTLSLTLVLAIPLHESDSFADLAQRDGEFERELSYASSEVYDGHSATRLEADAFKFERNSASDVLYGRDVEYDLDLHERANPPKPRPVQSSRSSGGADLANALSDLVNGLKSEPEARGEFVRKLLDTTSKAKPGFNVIAIHTKHSYAFQGVRGVDWGHEHVEFQRDAVPGTIGFEVYWFRKGWLRNEGDGGWLNWGYTGSPKREGGLLTYS